MKINENYTKETIKNIQDSLNRIANITCFDLGGIPVVLYDSHRTSAFIVFMFYKFGLIDRSCPPNLIHFDYHDDACECRNFEKFFLDEKGEKIELFDKSVKSFFSDLMFECSPLNNDWIDLLMRFSLIGDSCNVGGQVTNNIKDKPIRIDINGNEHHLYSIGHIDYALEEELSNDPKYSNEHIKKIFQFDNMSFSEAKNKIWLDIDLDCFSTIMIDYKSLWNDKENRGYADMSIPWTDKLFKGVYGSSERQNAANRFVRKLIDMSMCITIAREPRFCGGENGVYHILKNIDDHFFDGYLNV